MTQDARLDEALDLLLRFIRGVFAISRRQAAELGVDVSPSQARVLVEVYRHPGGTLRELARRLKLSDARASRLVDGLVAAGLLVRTRDARDGRRIRIDISSRSRDFVKVAYRQRSAVLRRALAVGGIGFVNGLRALAEGAERMRDRPR